MSKAIAKKSVKKSVKDVKKVAKKDIKKVMKKDAKKVVKREVKKDVEPEAVKDVKPASVKSKLSKTQKKFFYDTLMKARAEFMEQVKFHADEALAQKDSAGERAGMATHMADLGSDNSRHDLELGLLTSEVDVVEMIEEALQRLKDDEFGVCLDCGCEIAIARLEAKPYARYCTRCKSRRERHEDPTRRSR